MIFIGFYFSAPMDGRRLLRATDVENAMPIDWSDAERSRGDAQRHPKATGR
jgi:hypothetical protein